MGDAALKAWVQFNPSVQWANKFVEPIRGLPFGTYLHAAPPKRQRTLTAPLDPIEASFWDRFQVFSAGEAEQRTLDQRESLFISKLPIDVRMIVYDLVLGGMVFHLDAQNMHSRILLYICRQPDAINDANHQCHALSSQRPSSAPRQEHQQATGLLPLLVTCRRIYTEAIHTLYSANTFEFSRNAAAMRFLKVMVPPQRLHSIRHFRWYFRIPHHPSLNSRSRRDWSDLFEFFTKEMTGLQSLYLVLQTNYPMQARIRDTDDAEGADWMKPVLLMAVEASRTRGCRVELVTEGVVHDLNQIFKETARGHTPAHADEILELTCVHVHRRVRLSLSGEG